MEEKGKIFVGPAGWSYPDWKDTVFSGTRGKVDALEFMSTYFDTIEINSTFYRVFPEGTVRAWTKRVRNDGSFLFTVKLYRGFTHDPSILTNSDRSLMVKVLEILQETGLLGAALAQFPYRFHNTKENRKYLVNLRATLPSEIPLFVEFRHRSWLHRAVEAFMRELGIGFCNIDQPQVSFSLPLTSIVTIPLGYLRCHGRNTETWFGEKSSRDSRYFYRYRREELSEIAKTALAIASRTERTFVVFNNHFKGNEVFDAMDFSEMLNTKRKHWPSWWKAISESLRKE
ncbi:MAG: DUF72 domain-containing protein [Syntrophobacterales bacterium]|nr:DUF72 domain-containing protein [Syntrophobacterales bacterium]